MHAIHRRKTAFSPYIKDAMVIGGKEDDYVSAIINIDFTMVGSGPKVTTYLTQHLSTSPKKMTSLTWFRKIC